MSGLVLTKKYGFAYLLFLIFLLLHLFLINADPIALGDFGRGAFTDEGLYIYQAKSYLKGNGFNITEADGFIKTPFFNLLLSPFLYFNNIVLLRIVVLCFCLFALFSFVNPIDQKVNRFNFFWLILISLLCHPIVFAHLHFSLAEGFVFAFALLALNALVNKNNIYLAIVFLSLAIGCKIQYIYLLVPLFGLSIWTLLRDKKPIKLIIALSPLLGLFVFYAFNFDFLRSVLSSQSEGKFQSFGFWWHRISYNLSHIFSLNANFIFLVLWFITTLFFVINWSAINSSLKRNLAGLYGLLILESHKLLLIYLPMRYMFLFFALLALIIFVQSVALSNNTMWMKLLGLACLILGFYFYVEQVKLKSCQMEEARVLIKNSIPKQAQLVGPWAPSLSMGLPIKAHTAWLNYFENLDLWQVKQGVFVVSELDHNDNDSLFIKKLDSSFYLSPMDTFQIYKWKISLSEIKAR